MRYLPAFLILFFYSCTPDIDTRPEQVMGFVPVYANAGTEIGSKTARSTTNAGKIYAYGSFIFQVEQLEGVHIIDYSDPSNARKVSFLQIPLCTEIAVKGGYLYANHRNDLLVFDLSQITAPKLVKRVENAFPIITNVPPGNNVYFECPDPARGVVIGWEEKLIDKPNCRR